ncbi:hypothetical protein ABB37_03867 [Leptomonas pyrrhocoris]|uniref:PHD-type domain-containing protein n=1 Tax=Leptomonas pyrrhocoris TaxID=157538 RepID=A0A0M9G3J7_LEPPY|nr:hypothetical protein ABB37_03867 [Leptomonas pyrrhocoris]XP_015659956.1 hypothetical protein ABB37_03867 [Leptomonas pyrrhocoris]XP_015659957.1 hypothetical protein ABB37_03867 [Leptomonas pyrrhocoris]KPA81516.1 hypothetical protein ABB37_03867 [Leptomonas pyrrhocoris]KPA81517.1 hypothetical protein ABB37_03867 [Leptomonas pyrrhocoris]KPA81518.1 hypothetical protein ABB37_03867 [Leptomonas pyrrhocoris]|eukprot:XP_015659955.1 hypothetical protein ABB37_03867 [Leptomonas pyrrhocoris]
MPASKPVLPSAAVKPASEPPRNTVDYIPSKLSYDTAIPISIFEDRREFVERCKPYDIIDGPNPLDDVHEETQHHSADVVSCTSVDTIKSKKSSTRSSRKRSRSPLKGGVKAYSVKEESDRDSSTAAAAPTFPVFTRPSRSGWAAEQLRDGRPYQLLRSRDMETHVRYVLDDYDYDWCAAQKLLPEVVQRGITYLEWAYASSLLTAATPHLDDPAVEAMSPLTSSGSIAGASAEQHNGSVPAFRNAGTSGGARGEANGAGVFSPTTNAIARLNQAKRSSERAKQAAAANASAFACALCSKSVYLLSQQPSSDGASGNGGRGAGRGRGGRGRGAAVAREVSGSKASSHSSAAGSSGAASKHSTAGSPAGSFPSHDVQHQGLRCCECGVVAHLRCWFLTEPPRLPEAWTCDACTNYAQHRKRSAGVCCVCGRVGGVLLPYVSAAAAVKDEGESSGNNNSNNHMSGEPSSQMQSPMHGGLSATPVAQSDMVCHAVCALTMPELSIQHKSTVLRRNGLVNMEERPYVYALRRVGKQKYAMHCIFCEHGGTGRCVQCHHPHCFEAMHASCAAEAHTVDCHTDVSLSPSTMYPTGSGVHGATVEAISGPCSPGGFSLHNNGGTGGAAGLTACWTSCSTYCRKHYGYSVSNSAGSAALGDKAEAEALALDLTGLLTGGDGVTSPVVQKRGRGRPPVMLVQQRVAERDLIERLHAYWLERREQRRRSSGQLVSEINARLRHVVEAALRPEIVKVSADKVRLSHFLSLVPEWQWQLVAIVEGELPLPDEEYDDVQKYRKVAHTRRSGNTRSLYDRMSVAATQLNLMCRITTAMTHECQLRRTSAELELDSLRKLCMWR